MWFAITVVALTGILGLVYAEATGLGTQQLFEYFILILIVLVHFGRGHR